MTAPDDLNATNADMADLDRGSDSCDLRPAHHGPAANDHGLEAGVLPPVEVIRPRHQSAAVVFASPHSGRDYPLSFVRASNLDPLALRRSEDAFVDELFRAAPKLGAPLVKAHFPRAYVDANREAFELDPDMFDSPLPGYVKTNSSRISAGLGTVARVVANGEDIYTEQLNFAEVEQRIMATHVPYHLALEEEIGAAVERFGGCLLIDCHSMPSQKGVKTSARHGLADVVLGDCHGLSASEALVAQLEHIVEGVGLRVSRNRPYAGGFTTKHYGRPEAGVHAIQLELNRALYLDERTITRAPQMMALERKLERVIAELCAIDPAELIPCG